MKTLNYVLFEFMDGDLVKISSEKIFSLQMNSIQKLELINTGSEKVMSSISFSTDVMFLINKDVLDYVTENNKTVKDHISEKDVAVIKFIYNDGVSPDTFYCGNSYSSYKDQISSVCFDYFILSIHRCLSLS